MEHGREGSALTEKKIYKINVAPMGLKMYYGIEATQFSYLLSILFYFESTNFLTEIGR